jgi:hypothetical protein
MTTFTLEELRAWLDQELSALTRSTQMRAQEAVAFVIAFASGEISAQQAADRHTRYQNRWGDSPIPGMLISADAEDEEILDRLDSRWGGTYRQAYPKQKTTSISPMSLRRAQAIVREAEKQHVRVAVAPKQQRPRTRRLPKDK